MTRPPVPFLAPAAVSAWLIGGAVAMTWYGVAIAADGSYFLVRVLGADSYFGPGQRILADAARQSPVLLATSLGVTDTHILTLLYGGGQLVLTAITWSAAIFICRADRTAFVVVGTTAALCAGSTWLFSVSENVLAVPVAVLVAVLLWRPRTWHWSHALLACSGSFLLVASYETAVVTGVALGTWAAWRARYASTRIERYGCLFVACTAPVSIVVAIIGASAGGPGPTHAQAFIYYLASLEPWPFFVGLAGVVVLVGALELRISSRVVRGLAGVGCALVAIGAVGVETTFAAAYEARGGASAAAFLVSVFLWWRWVQDRRVNTDRADAGLMSNWLLAVPVAAAAVLMAADVAASRSWSQSLDAFRASVDHETGLRPVDSVLPEDRREVLWGWTSSSLSLIVRSDPDGAILYDRHPSYVPFLPSEAREQIPERYTWRS